MATQYSPKIVTDNMILCLDAANPRSYPRSGTTWNDLSGNGNNGTLINGPTFSNSNSGIITFDGTNDYVNCSNGSSVNITGNSFTLSAWVNKISWTADHTLIHKDLQYSLALRQIGGVNVVTYADSSNWSYVSFGYHGSFLSNVWYNIVMVKSGTTVTIYSNNAVVISKTFGTTITGTSNNLIIGAYNDSVGSPTFFGYENANVAQVSIYNRALSSVEVSQNFNATRSRFGV